MKRIVTVTVLSLALLAQPSAAQPVRPYDRFDGQADQNGNTCISNGSDRDRRVCAWMWVRAEEAALNEIVSALQAKANAAPPAPTVAESGYAGALPNRTQAEALAAAQASWLAWRNDECVLGTIEAQGGSMRRLTYPICVARLTELRRERLTNMLTLWNGEFDGPHGRPASALCELEPAACPARD